MIDQLYNIFKYVVFALLGFLLLFITLMVISIFIAGYNMGVVSEQKARLDNYDGLFKDMYVLLKAGQEHREQLETEGAFNARMRKGKDEPTKTK